MSLKSIESFCGAGGMSYGLKLAGYDVRAAFDNVQAHIDTHNGNLGDTGHVLDASVVAGDELLALSGLFLGKLDLFSGGPPCQGFSKQKRGAEPRNHSPRSCEAARIPGLVPLPREQNGRADTNWKRRSTTSCRGGRTGYPCRSQQRKRDRCGQAPRSRTERATVRPSDLASRQCRQRDWRSRSLGSAQ